MTSFNVLEITVSSYFQFFSRSIITYDNTFFMHLTEQSDQVAQWSESTIKKLGGVLMNILVQNEYLLNSRAKDLQPVFLQSPVRDAVKRHQDEWMLSAFNAI